MRRQYIIIYLDLVRYSKKLETVQLDLFNSLQNEVNFLLNNMDIKIKKIVIPTGDGMIIGLEDNLHESYVEALSFIVSIYNWETKINERLRASIHFGNIYVIEDINGNNNMVGDVINNTSRMLDGAKDGSIVISREFAELYLKSRNTALGEEICIDDKLSLKLIDEDSIIDKHGFRHYVYSIVLYKKGKQYGKEAKILNKYFTSIYSIDYPKQSNLVNSFLEKVENCSTLILFGIYQPSILEIVKKLNIKKDEKVVINIYYASDDLKDTIENFFNSNSGNLDISKKNESQKEIALWYKSHKYKENIILNILEYREFSPFGFSMIDHYKMEKGFIHFSNYIPNILPDETPYIEVEWKTKQMPPIYRFYYDFIDLNILQSEKIVKIDFDKEFGNE